MKVLKMLIKQMTGQLTIVNNWRGYSTAIKKRTPFYCKLELFNANYNHFIYVYCLNNKGLSKIEINKNIYKSIIKEGKKYDRS